MDHIACETVPSALEALALARLFPACLSKREGLVQDKLGNKADTGKKDIFAKGQEIYAQDNTVT